MHSCPDAQASADKLTVLWDEKGHTFVCALMLSGVKSIDNGPLEKSLLGISYIYYSEIPAAAYLWLAGILALSIMCSALQMSKDAGRAASQLYVMQSFFWALQFHLATRISRVSQSMIPF